MWDIHDESQELNLFLHLILLILLLLPVTLLFIETSLFIFKHLLLLSLLLFLIISFLDRLLDYAFIDLIQLLLQLLSPLLPAVVALVLWIDGGCGDIWQLLLLMLLRVLSQSQERLLRGVLKETLVLLSDERWASVVFSALALKVCWVGEYESEIWTLVKLLLLVILCVIIHEHHWIGQMMVILAFLGISCLNRWTICRV